MRRPAAPAAVAVLLVILASCGSSSGSSGRDVEELRLRLYRTRCLNRMDSLAFRLQGMMLDLEEPDAAALDSAAALLGDTLTSCPQSDLPYSLEIREGDLVVTCPEGHGRRSTDLL